MAFVENPSREKILERIRTALRNPAPRHPSPPPRPFFAEVTDPVTRFQAECTANLTECVLTSSQADSAAAIARVLASLPAGEIFVQDAPELQAMSATWPRGIRWSSAGGPSETSQATISKCEGLIAMTGSIVVSSSCGGRGASVVAPCHIVYATIDQLVPDLEAAMARIYSQGTAEKNSFVGLITGSSRTADIEKILVLGAHGPRRLVVVLQTT
jgi:L-lactate dehydrogenase complex protein LldG